MPWGRNYSRIAAEGRELQPGVPLSLSVTSLFGTKTTLLFRLHVGTPYGNHDTLQGVERTS